MYGTGLLYFSNKYSEMINFNNSSFNDSVNSDGMTGLEVPLDQFLIIVIVNRQDLSGISLPIDEDLV